VQNRWRTHLYSDSEVRPPTVDSRRAGKSLENEDHALRGRSVSDILILLDVCTEHRIAVARSAPGGFIRLCTIDQSELPNRSIGTSYMSPVDLGKRRR